MQFFTNSALHVTNIDQTIYTCLANEDVTIHNLLITNSSDSLDVKIKVKLIKDSESFFVIPENFIVSAGTTLEMKPINLSPGDQLVISSDINGFVDAIASILKEVRDF